MKVNELLECDFLHITYPQLTQAMVPWPFTVWATSESSFSWESPDVATDRINFGQPGYQTHSTAQDNPRLETQKALSWLTRQEGIKLQ